MKLLGPVFVVGLVSGCQVVGGYESFQAGSQSASPAHRCDILDKDMPRPELGGSMVLTKQETEDCFWIDQTEVTVDHYRQFVFEALSPLRWTTMADEQSCSWKLSPSDPESTPDDACTLLTQSEDIPFANDKPIRCVDWCDALAYCRWAGKSLCSTRPLVLITTSEQGQDWTDACSDDLAPFPYGGTEVVPLACNIGMSTAECANVLDLSACGPTAVPSAPPLDCISPDGAADMVGNVAEWSADCGKLPAMEPMAQECQTKGGSFADDESVNCHTRSKYEVRTTRAPTIGFRCCDELSDFERSQL